MKLLEKYLKECGCEASEYNEVENGSEPKSVEDTIEDIEDEILEEDLESY